MHYKINTKNLVGFLKIFKYINSELIQFILVQIEYFEGASSYIYPEF